MIRPDEGTRAILAALDRDDVSCFADINASAPDLAAALFHRFGCSVELIGMTETGAPMALSDKHVKAYRETLARNGAEDADVRALDPGSPIKTYDVIATLEGFGSRYKIKHFKAFLDQVLSDQSRLVLDIKKGSGSYPFLKAYGGCNTLTEPGRDRPGRAVLSVEPQTGPAEDWSGIARQLAGPDGFYRDLEEHSFVYIPRGDTLVVTFDNLDIAMTKRDDRRPWGFSFIESQGWSMLGVMANGWTWFRDAAVDAEFDHLRDEGFFDGFKRVVFYGASMGGYAAAAFSAAAPGSTVFVTSPQSTLDKALVPWEKRYKKAWDRDFSGPYGDAAVSSLGAQAVHILYDPYIAADAAHAARFTGENAIHWRCPLLGHRLGSSLSQMGALKDIAVAAIEGRLDRQLFYSLLRRRRDLPRYLRELIYHAIERDHPALALRACDFALRHRPDPSIRNLAKKLAAQA